jgi:hypothetical protein
MAPLLTASLRQEALSKAYVRALSGACGFTVADRDFDMDGVDLEINAGGNMRPSLAVQLKATTTLLPPKDGVIKYALKVRNYDLLRISTQTPRLLILLDMPALEAEWIEVGDDALLLRRRAYWMNLLGQPATPNEATITIDIPEANRLTKQALEDLLNQSATGAIA